MKLKNLQFSISKAFSNSSLLFTVPVIDKSESYNKIYKVNIARAKISAVMFIFIEIMLIVVSVAADDFTAEKMFFGYIGMYTLMLLAAIVFLLLFIKLEKKAIFDKRINLAVILFVIISLCWSAGISLLDQITNGQVIVYVVSTLAVAVIILLEPVVIISIYICVTTIFLMLMPHFAKDSELVFGNVINTISFVLISLLISYMRYKSQIMLFNDAKLIHEKNDELLRINLELEQANQKLEKLSQTDGLTGISNRFMFDITIKSEWERCKRQHTPLSFLMIDIDCFKLFNDNYGHRAGDVCLKQVADVLLSCVKRSSDMVARYGGEEFAVILPYTDGPNAFELAEIIRNKVELLSIPHEYSAISNYVTISLGVTSVVPTSTLSIDEFINNADKALYEAKNFRNKTEVFKFLYAYNT